jgi:uncharacterized ferritin-like protein (DUF455 family)
VADASLATAALGVLGAAEPGDKVARTAAAARAWRGGGLAIGAAAPPPRPARPDQPVLLPPGAMPKRSTGPKGRIALLHALAHIELNAIDLAWDILARFGADMPRTFADDWVRVADEEARHFALLAERLAAWGAAYGDLPAHDGLWQAASLTMDDLSARLVLVPMTLEARGIDVTPATAARFRRAGDAATAEVLDAIYADEVGHLAIGVRWFEYLCVRARREPCEAFRSVLAERFTGSLKGPFNLPARAQAGMGADYLAPWIG